MMSRDITGIAKVVSYLDLNGCFYESKDAIFLEIGLRKRSGSINMITITFLDKFLDIVS
jgi:hypothetical protein